MSLIQEWNDILTLPLNHGLQVSMIKWTERPSTWIERPTCSTYQDLLAQTTSLDIIHMLIMNSVKRRAETCRTQAGRPTIFSVEATQLTPSFREDQERPREGRRQTAKIPGRPAKPAPLWGVLSSSSRGSYVNRPSCIQPTPRPNTDL